MTIVVGASMDWDEHFSTLNLWIPNPIYPVTQDHVDAGYTYVILIGTAGGSGSPYFWVQYGGIPDFGKPEFQVARPNQDIHVYSARASIVDSPTFTFELQSPSSLSEALGLCFTLHSTDGLEIYPAPHDRSKLLNYVSQLDNGAVDIEIDLGNVITSNNAVANLNVMFLELSTNTADASMTELFDRGSHFVNPAGRLQLYVQYEIDYLEGAARVANFVTVGGPPPDLDILTINMQWYESKFSSGGLSRPKPKSISHKRIMTPVPDIVSGYTLDDARSFWGIVVPEATKNELIDPSFEYVQPPATAISQYGMILNTGDDARVVDGVASKGFRSLRTISNGSGETNLKDALNRVLLNIPYTYSFDLYQYNDVVYTLDIYSDPLAGPETLVLTESWTSEITGWVRKSFSFSSTERFVHIYHITPPGNPANTTMFIDARQLEEKPYATTYCDGDVVGYSHDDYWWDGEGKRSGMRLSYRSANTRHGGRIIYLDEAEFETMSYTGLGMGPVDVSSVPIGIGGEIYTGSKKAPRAFTITGVICADNIQELMRNRSEIIDLVNPDLTKDPQPIKLIYQLTDQKAQTVGEAGEIDCVYVEGLGGITNNFFQERIALQFIAHDPGIRSAFNSITSMRAWKQAFPYISLLHRDIFGEWHLMNSVVDDITFNYYAMEWYQNYIAMGGNFTALDGFSHDNIALYDTESEFWRPLVGSLGLGGNNAATRALSTLPGPNAFSTDPVLIMGGEFTTVDDGVNAALRLAYYDGTESDEVGGGANNTVHAVYADPRGRIYVGGEFTEVDSSAVYGGPTAVSRLAYWNEEDEEWDDMDNGVGGTVYDIIQSPDGFIYIAGDFIKNSVGRVTRWDPVIDAYDSLEDGFADGIVYSLSFDKSGTLFASGTFTTTDGGAAVEGLAKYNGFAWVQVADGSNATGANAKMLHHDSDGFLWIGEFSWNTFTPEKERGIMKMYGDSYLRPPFKVSNNTSGHLDWYDMVEADDGRMAMCGDANVTQQGAGPSDEERFIYLGVWTNIVNNGNAEAFPTFVFTGPGILWEITNETAKTSIYFNNLYLNENEIMVVDLSKPGSPMFYSDIRSNLTSYVHMPASDFSSFRILPGDNIVSVVLVGDTFPGANLSNFLPNSNTTAFCYFTESHWSIDSFV